jgi:hypothetical protein
MYSFIHVRALTYTRSYIQTWRAFDVCMHMNTMYREIYSFIQSYIPTYRPSGRRLSPQLVPILTGTGCRMVSITDPYGCWSRSSRQEKLLLFQITPEISSQGWLDPVSDPLLIRKNVSAAYRTRDLWNCSQEIWPLNHRGGHIVRLLTKCHGVWFSFILIYPHSFIHSFYIHSSFVCSTFIHHSFILSFLHSLIQFFIRSFIHSFIHLFIHSFIYSFIHSFIHFSFVYSSSYTHIHY